MSDIIYVALMVAVAIFGGGTTYLLAHKTNMGAVRASAFLSLILGIVFHSHGLRLPFLSEIPFIFIGASFVGMTAPSQLNLIGIFFASCIFGVLYLVLPPIYDGVGGTLGTAACVSVLVTSGVHMIFRRRSKKKRPI